MGVISVVYRIVLLLILKYSGTHQHRDGLLGRKNIFFVLYVKEPDACMKRLV